MLMMLQIASTLLVSVAMSLALAHALELPGKRRLAPEMYRVIQQIYYPGFTYAGFSEPMGIIALLALLVASPRGSTRFALTLLAFVCLVTMHGVYWLFTHPINRLWLEGADLGSAGARFFGVAPTEHRVGERPHDEASWRRLRNRWERSHVVRAALGLLALAALIVSLAS
jgi:hypothetical protein